MEGVLIVKSRVESDQKKGRLPDLAVSQSCCLYRVLLCAGTLHFASTAQQASAGRANQNR